ncbi:MAG: SpoIVB peptidase [Candidatus Dichloromethanomonas elyunquensis]|nr:MAG: SpoIVB peptidase [Candidatus Dichloromethanomonas elyunquensis]
MIKKQSNRLMLIGLLFVFTFSIQQSLVNHYNSSLLSEKNLFSQIQLNNNRPVYNFFGLFSNEKEVNKLNIAVIPGGHSIGVTLQTKGVLVVGYAPIVNQQGNEVFPAKESGIEIGDTILKIDNIQAVNDYQVAEEIDKKCKEKQTISLEIKHKDRILQKKIDPVYCSETKRNRIGLFIRDEAAGVGTLTFIDPKTKIFGALGHGIVDMDTNQQIELSDGKIMESTIYGIQKGKKGDPGEKIGTFLLQSSFSGKIEKNFSSGIFGSWEGKMENPYFKTPIPVAWKSEIQTGPAKIYTVIKDNQIQEFDIRIEKLMPFRNDNKDMIIRVTDPILLEQTGGIVQGMSGSPIIQDGKIIGAVTHVFVNDSSRGYGISIEKMLSDSGVIHKAATALRGGNFFLKISRRNCLTIVENIEDNW